MPALPYCVLLADSGMAIPPTGVAQSPIASVRHGELLTLYSEMEKIAISPSSLKDAALEFHNTVHAVFRQTAVVPFRFPAWLSIPELEVHLAQQSSRYESFLREHRDDVQMEVRVLLASTQASGLTPRSGTEHLRSRAAQYRRLARIGAKVRQMLGPEVSEWRERETPEGLRLFAFVRREYVQAFREKLGGQKSDVHVRHSGPWPATEFLPAELQRNFTHR